MVIKNQIDKLLNSALRRKKRIRDIIRISVYENKFHDEIDTEFKNFLEDLKSALDYSANDIYKKYGITENAKIYFPINIRNKTIVNGTNSKFWKYLQTKNKRLYEYLEEINNNLDSNYDWLKEFNSLVNENKHRNFTIKYLNRGERTAVENKIGSKIEWQKENVKFSKDVKFFGKNLEDVKTQKYIVGTIFIGELMPISFFCNLCLSKISNLIEKIYQIL